jgi:hypothetical protein
MVFASSCERPSYRPEPGPLRACFKSPIVGPWEDRYYTQHLAVSIAERIAQKLENFRDQNGHYPDKETFWQSLGSEPIHNPLNGSSTIVIYDPSVGPVTGMWKKVGWIIFQSGTVQAGGQPTPWN